MRVSDDAIDEVHAQGFALAEGFIGRDEMADAQAGFAGVFPAHDEFFADPTAHAAGETR